MLPKGWHEGHLPRLRYQVYNCHAMSFHILLTAWNKCKICIYLKAMHCTNVYWSLFIKFRLITSFYNELNFQSSSSANLECHSLRTQSWTKSKMRWQMLWENIRVSLTYLKQCWQKQQKPEYVKCILLSESTWINHCVTALLCPHKVRKESNVICILNTDEKHWKIICSMDSL